MQLIPVWALSAYFASWKCCDCSHTLNATAFFCWSRIILDNSMPGISENASEPTKSKTVLYIMTTAASWPCVVPRKSWDTGGTVEPIGKRTPVLRSLLVIGWGRQNSLQTITRCLKPPLQWVLFFFRLWISLVWREPEKHPFASICSHQFWQSLRPLVPWGTVVYFLAKAS